MPTPQDLDRLRGLLTQLEQIGEARRGELIRAEDWNSLVLAVADIARSVLATDAVSAAPPHEHLDQATSAWLAPPLRELLLKGPLSDPAAQKRLTELEQNLRRVREEQDSSNKKVDEFRGRLTEVGARDVEREAAITRVRRTIESVADPRDELQSMRTTLGSIERDLTSVQEAASRLTVGGQVVDLGSVLRRVGDLEEIRERLTTGNGELLDAATVERRIAEIGNKSVSQETLDEALRDRPAIPDSEIAEIEGRLRTNLREQVNGQLENFRGEVRGELEREFDNLGDLVSTRVNDALPGLEESLTVSLTGRIEESRRLATEEAVSTARRAIDASAEELRGEIESQVADVNAGVADTVSAQVNQRLAARLGDVQRRIDGTVERLDSLSAEVSRHGEVQQRHTTELAGLPQQLTSIRNEMRETIISEIDVRTTTLNRTIDDRFSSFERTQDQRFSALSREVKTSAVDAARSAATETARTESRAIRTQLLAEMRGIAREEVSIAIRDQVKVAVNESVDAKFAAVPGMIATEVRRQTTITRGGVITNPIGGLGGGLG
jgi:hypothetical protein